MTGTPSPARDHGGGLDAAIARWGGTRTAWVDLSTGINPVPYPLPAIPDDAWTALPDQAAQDALLAAARAFWQVPAEAGILAAPGASALIARLPALAPGADVCIPGPTYNEHGAAFRAHGFAVAERVAPHRPLVIVHPNNPDGRIRDTADIPDGLPFVVIDESFADVTPDRSLVQRATQPGVVVLKSFGKFWGLAGVRLGFAIGHPDTLAPLAEALGPWPVAGPALSIGTAALHNTVWATQTRARLARDAARLDRLFSPHGTIAGGTDLFRLYEVEDAAAMQDRLAEHHIWSRIFPYSKRWIRLGLPAPEAWARIEAAL